jgi:uncharacterized protein YcfJ
MNNLRMMIATGLLLGMGVAVADDAAAAVHCHDRVVYRERPVQDHDRVVGTVAGAVIGGVIGHQFGGGNGKTLATVGGAAAGGYAGNQIQKSHQHRRYRTVERVCTHD